MGLNLVSCLNVLGFPFVTALLINIHISKDLNLPNFVRYLH